LPQPDCIRSQHVDRRYHFDGTGEPHAAMLTC
jgi:hypothetical protein